MGKMEVGPLKGGDGRMRRRGVNRPNEFKDEILRVFERREPMGRMVDISKELDDVVGREVGLQRRHPNITGGQMKAVLAEMVKLHPGYQEVFDKWTARIDW